MKQYQDILRFVLENGIQKADRTGTGVISSFNVPPMVFDLSAGFPAVTTKKLAWKATLSELLWFIEGSGDERRLAEILHDTRDNKKVTIWTENREASYWKPKAKYDGDLGRIYGVQWRDWRTPVNKKWWELWKPNFKSTDQLLNLIHSLKTDPYSRRHILTAWNPGEFDQMALPPCHIFAQFYVVNGKLSCKLYQRSADLFLGVPFNIASYSLFTHMLAQVCDLEVGEFIHVLGDAHIYLNHIDAVKEQLSRTPHTLPTLGINKQIKNIEAFTMKDLWLENYTHDAAIKAEMAV